ncbi:hypothetical protein MMC30_005938 [Trapelia coarctata]|nr:hypothetical protein [Trapelia coarctata]
MPSAVRTPSVGTFNEPIIMRSPTDSIAQTPLNTIASGDEADTDGEHDARHRLRLQVNMPSRRDFQEKMPDGAKSPESQVRKPRKRKHRKHHHRDKKRAELSEKHDPPQGGELISTPLSHRVSFLQDVQIIQEAAPKRPFNLRGISVRPAIPKMLTSTVFSAANPSGPPDFPLTKTTVPPAPYGLRRATSLPDRLNKAQSAPSPGPQQNHLAANASTISIQSEDSNKAEKHLSRTSAVVLLLISTALVAVCADFLVNSIGYLVSNTGVSEEFIGLIILPIVGNAAEHVTAVTVASRNKMDLAIGVAVGSSIQIALFVTPVIVLLGWALGKDMSLYFSLFETIALFVSAFIVNFLVLDGRSNYLEGALLIAAYVIIGVAAFFYPDSSQQSTIGGAAPTIGHMMF